jgi:hypothetical protein
MKKLGVEKREDCAPQGGVRFVVDREVAEVVPNGVESSQTQANFFWGWQ